MDEDTRISIKFYTHIFEQGENSLNPNLLDTLSELHSLTEDYPEFNKLISEEMYRRIEGTFTEELTRQLIEALKGLSHRPHSRLTCLLDSEIEPEHPNYIPF
jgi:hypothetical protein